MKTTLTQSEAINATYLQWKCLNQRVNTYWPFLYTSLKTRLRPPYFSFLTERLANVSPKKSYERNEGSEKSRVAPFSANGSGSRITCGHYAGGPGRYTTGP